MRSYLAIATRHGGATIRLARVASCAAMLSQWNAGTACIQRRRRRVLIFWKYWTEAIPTTQAKHRKPRPVTTTPKLRRSPGAEKVLSTVMLTVAVGLEDCSGAVSL